MTSARPPVQSLHLAMSAAALLAAAGCIELEKPYPEKSYYVLEATRPAPRRPAPNGVTLRVEEPSLAAAAGSGQQFVIRRGERWETDFHHLFFAPPQSMIGEAVRRWLSDSGALAAVVAPGSRVDPTHILEVSIRRLLGVRGATPPLAVLELEVLLVEHAGTGERIVLERDYAESVAIDDERAESLVAGWSRALARILAALEEDVVRATTGASAAASGQ